MLVYLDNMIWSYLVDRSAERLTIELVKRAHTSGLIQIVGSLPLEEEMLLIAESDRNGYKRRLQLYHRLTDRRVLIPLRDRHLAESSTGGLLTVGERYLDLAVQRQLRIQAYDRTAIKELSVQIKNEKLRNAEADGAARGSARSHIRELIVQERAASGVDVDPDDHLAAKQIAKQADRSVADWYQMADVDDWLDDVVEYGVVNDLTPGIVEPSRITLPSAWLFTKYRFARIKRNIADNRAVQESDHHDAEHCAAGFYYDLLVTNDHEFSETLFEIRDLPFRVASPESFADELVAALA